MQITVVDHPLIRIKLAICRDKRTRTMEFRNAINQIGTLMAFEVLRDFPVVEHEVETPLEKTVGFAEKKELCLMPIMRAGMGFCDGFLRVVPDAHVGLIGLKRDEQTLQPKFYYFNVPPNKDAYYVVLDPMLATGGSAVDCISRLKEAGIKDIRFMCLVAAPQGVEALNKAHPDVKIYAAVLDRELNDVGYILPGLGDAGDRIFGTVIE